MHFCCTPQAGSIGLCSSMQFGPGWLLAAFVAVHELLKQRAAAGFSSVYQPLLVSCCCWLAAEQLTHFSWLTHCADLWLLFVSLLSIGAAACLQQQHSSWGSHDKAWVLPKQQQEQQACPGSCPHSCPGGYLE